MKILMMTEHSIFTDDKDYVNVSFGGMWDIKILKKDWLKVADKIKQEAQ